MRASQGAISEVVGGSRTLSVSGAVISTAGGGRIASSTGDTKLTVGALASVTATGKLQVRAPTIEIVVTGMASFLGGGGVVNLTPASATFIGLITVSGSAGVEVSGMPNLVG